VADVSFVGASIILSNGIRMIPRDMSFGSNTIDLEHSRSLPCMLFILVLGSLFDLAFLDPSEDFFGDTNGDDGGAGAKLDDDEAFSSAAEELREREEDAITPQSCNSCSPCSSSKVEKRCSLLSPSFTKLSWWEEYR